MIYIFISVWKKQEDMSPCTDNRLTSNSERIASCAVCHYLTVIPKFQRRLRGSEKSNKCFESEYIAETGRHVSKFVCQSVHQHGIILISKDLGKLIFEELWWKIFSGLSSQPNPELHTIGFVEIFAYLVHLLMMTSSNGNLFRVTGLLCGGFHGSPVNSPHKGQWRGALTFLYRLLNKRLGKQSRRRWFETPSRSLWRHCNVLSQSD